MRLVFLYGPPGVGKLTVARALVALTGFRLFHNHLTVDLVGSVFPRHSPAFGPLVHRFRREMFAAAAREDVDLVFTYVYAHPEDEPDVRDLLEPVLAGGGEVHFVQLTCTREALLERVASESRRAYRKLTDPAAVGALLDRHDLTAAVPFAESLRLDTTATPPAEAARKIAARYALPSLARDVEGQAPGRPA
jgi:chloramphenicol 3-O-phosphotransferase